MTVPPMIGPPEAIYIIRHAEKPQKPPSSGVDYQGGRNEHSLLPRGWQRSGALAALFHPAFGPMRAGLRTPTALVAPSWGHPGKTAAHRSCTTTLMAPGPWFDPVAGWAPAAKTAAGAVRPDGTDPRRAGAGRS